MDGEKKNTYTQEKERKKGRFLTQSVPSWATESK